MALAQYLARFGVETGDQPLNIAPWNNAKTFI